MSRFRLCTEVLLFRGNSFSFREEGLLDYLCFKQREIASKHSNLARIYANKREFQCSFQKGQKSIMVWYELGQGWRIPVRRLFFSQPVKVQHISKVILHRTIIMRVRSARWWTARDSRWKRFRRKTRLSSLRSQDDLEFAGKTASLWCSECESVGSSPRWWS